MGAHHNHGGGVAHSVLDEQETASVWKAMTGQILKDAGKTGLAAGTAIAIDATPLDEALPNSVKLLANMAASAPMFKDILIPDVMESLSLGNPEGRDMADLTMAALAASLAGVGIISSGSDWISEDSGMDLITGAALVALTFRAAGGIEEGIDDEMAEAITKHLELIPQTVTRVRWEGEPGDESNAVYEDIPLNEVEPGDFVLVRSHGFIPVDGVIHSIDGNKNGAGEVDSEFYNGQLKNRAIESGEPVLQGEVAQEQALLIEVKHKAIDSGAQKFLEALAEAPEAGRETTTNAQIDTYINRAFLPGIFSIFGLSVARQAFNKEDRSFNLGDVDWGEAVKYTAEGSLAAAPCPWNASTAIYGMAQSGLAGLYSIDVRNKAGFETLATVDTVVSDMTGTMTLGEPHVTDWHFSDASKAQDAFAAIARLEQQAEHPYARAIVGHAKQQELHLNGSIPQLHEDKAGGVDGVLDGKRIIVGTHSYVTRHLGDDLPEIPAAILKQQQELDKQGKTTSFAYIDGEWGVLGFDDQLRPEVPGAVAELRKRGHEFYVVTGDKNGDRVVEIARQAGVDVQTREPDGSLKYVKYGVEKEDKEAFVAQLRGEGRTIAAFGDGTNDTQMIAESAHAAEGENPGVGIAIKGRAVDTTQISAGLVVNGIHELPALMDMSQKVNGVAQFFSNLAKVWMGALVSFFGFNFLRDSHGPHTAVWAIAHEMPTVMLMAAQGVMTNQFLRKLGSDIDADVDVPRTNFLDQFKKAFAIRKSKNDAFHAHGHDHHHDHHDHHDHHHGEELTVVASQTQSTVPDQVLQPEVDGKERVVGA